ncbi:MarR family transcriptional regulator [Streptomyces sp. NPDC054796]
MPTHPDMTTDIMTNDAEADAEIDVDAGVAAAHPAATGEEHAGGAVLDAMQHQVAVFARRAEQTRLGGVGQARNSMDRAAYLLLNRLDQEGPMGVKALAAGMGIDSSTVTRQVAPLVDSGLVKRTSHPEDGRAVVLQLSPRGAARLEQVRASRRDLMALLTEEWSEEERESFCTLLTRFNTSLLGIHPSTTPGPPAS